MRPTLKTILAISLLLLMLAPCLVLAVEAEPAGVEDTRRQLLDKQRFLAWERINEARRNPSAVLARLGIPAEQAMAALGEDAWILEKGLPPIAMNDQLVAAANQHGRDMVTRVYYSHFSPEGAGPYERIAGTGYQAVREDETLAALVFSSYVELAPAVDFMIDTMLRDELVATPGVHRNIFSPEFSEMGIAFLAETISLVEGELYVYLFVLDFAKPLNPQRYLIGMYGNPDRRPLLMPLAIGLWWYQPVLGHGFFQIPYPRGGAAVVLVDEAAQTVSDAVFVYDDGGTDHQLVDLRALP